MALVGYILAIEFLYFHSKLSFLKGLGFFQEVFLLLRCSALLVTVISPFLILGSVLVWWLNKKGKSNGALLSSLFLYPLPFAVFALCNYFYFDRWTYSTFKYNMVDRSLLFNIILFFLFIAIGYVLYFVNVRQIAAFARRWKSLVIALFIVLVGSGSILILNAYSKDSFRMTITQNQESMATHPNIIILSYDMFEAAHTPLLDYYRNTTPNLMKRKDEFFIFSNNTAVAVESRAGTVGLFTGRSPATTQVLSYPDRLKGTHVYEHWPARLKELNYYNTNYGHDQYSNPSYYNMKNGFSEINGKPMEVTSFWGKIIEKVQFMFLIESLVMK
jgi:hypothetical protein